MYKIFCYGTLKKGHGNHRLLSSSALLGTAVSEPAFTMLHLGGFPGIVAGGETAISGEVYEVDAVTLARLDRLEGHPTFYERTPMTVNMDGADVAVEGYVLQSAHPSYKAIESGVWTKGEN